MSATSTILLPPSVINLYKLLFDQNQTATAQNNNSDNNSDETILAINNSCHQQLSSPGQMNELIKHQCQRQVGIIMNDFLK